MRTADTLTIHPHCPHCGASMTAVATLTIAGEPSVGHDGDGFDDEQDAYVTGCESCGERFAVPRMLATDAQFACLILIGEADES